MSRRRTDAPFRSAPKQPPPEQGVRMKKAGTTWWGQRWIGALEEVLRGDAARLARGRTYARAGRTHDLLVTSGKVTAKVTGSRATPYDIAIGLVRLGEDTWDHAIEGMAQKAQFSAELLAGQMPKEIDEVFRAAGASLFPQQRSDLKTSCSCPDWGDPCKHVAATHYVLGEALDRDPFLLFELRGKTKAQVLEALRAARSRAHEPPDERNDPVKPADPMASQEVPAVFLGKLAAADYDRPRQALPALHFDFEQPATHGAVLRQLGAPAAWQGNASPADVLAPLVRRAAEAARRLAMAESRDTNDAPVDASDVPNHAKDEQKPATERRPPRARPRRKRSAR
ncbi:MAG TPA: SWIM zinc finger family protein [Polyangiaceae bacterium]